MVPFQWRICLTALQLRSEAANSLAQTQDGKMWCLTETWHTAALLCCMPGWTGMTLHFHSLALISSAFNKSLFDLNCNFPEFSFREI